MKAPHVTALVPMSSPDNLPVGSLQDAASACKPAPWTIITSQPQLEVVNRACLPGLVKLSPMEQGDRLVVLHRAPVMMFHRWRLQHCSVCVNLEIQLHESAGQPLALNRNRLIIRAAQPLQYNSTEDFLSVKSRGGV